MLDVNYISVTLDPKKVKKKERTVKLVTGF